MRRLVTPSAQPGGTRREAPRSDAAAASTVFMSSRPPTRRSSGLADGRGTCIDGLGLPPPAWVRATRGELLKDPTT